MKIVKSNKPKISRAQKKANKKAIKQNKKQNKIIKREQIAEKVADFFELKFLKTKKALKITRTRKTIRAIVVAISASITTILGVIVLIAGIKDGGDALAGLAIILLALTTHLPAGFKAIKDRYKARRLLKVERAEVNKWYYNARTLKQNQKTSKKHSKWSKKGAKGKAKIAADEAKFKAKEFRKAEKAKAIENANNDVFVGVTKKDVKVDPININKR